MLDKNYKKEISRALLACHLPSTHMVYVKSAGTNHYKT